MTPEPRQGWSVGPQVVFGLAVVFFGLLLTARNLNLVGPIGHVIRFWPLAFTAFGVALLLEKGSSSSRRLFGGVLVIGGLWQTANTAFGLGIYIDDYWPMVLVGIGVLLVLRAISPAAPPVEDYTNVGAPGSGPAMGAAAPASASAAGASGRDDTINAFAFMGGVRRNIVSASFRGGNVTAIMGGVVLDLRQSQASGGETVVEVFAIWSGIEVKVPPDWHVVNEVSPIMGGVEDQSAHAQPTRHRLVLKGVVFMAGVEIKS